jgi:hypothetical protein
MLIELMSNLWYDMNHTWWKYLLICDTCYNEMWHCVIECDTLYDAMESK